MRDVGASDVPDPVNRTGAEERMRVTTRKTITVDQPLDDAAVRRRVARGKLAPMPQDPTPVDRLP